MNARAWTQDEIDADMERDSEPDVCHHNVGFDETCEWCEYEIAAEAAAQRATLGVARYPQADLFSTLPAQPGAELG